MFKAKNALNAMYFVREFPRTVTLKPSEKGPEWPLGPPLLAPRAAKWGFSTRFVGF